MKRSITILTCLALAACAGSEQATTTSLGTTTSTNGQGGTTTSIDTTTSITGTTSPPEVTTTQEAETVGVTAFYLEDSGGNSARVGPFLVAVHDPGVTTGSDAADAVEALLDGPPGAAAEAGIASAIPSGTNLISVDVGGDGVATVELSATFDDGGGSFTMFGRLAQLTYTLTALADIDSVLLMENGSVVEVFSAEGIVLDGPMTREDFQDLLPGILVESPAWGETVSLPFQATGVAAAFEAVFQTQLLVDDDVVFEPRFVMSSNGVGYGTFLFEVDADVAPPTPAVLRVWQFSAKDGSVTDERLVPLQIAGG